MCLIANTVSLFIDFKQNCVSLKCCNKSTMTVSVEGVMNHIRNSTEIGKCLEFVIKKWLNRFICDTSLVLCTKCFILAMYCPLIGEWLHLVPWWHSGSHLLPWWLCPGGLCQWTKALVLWDQFGKPDYLWYLDPRWPTGNMRCFTHA